MADGGRSETDAWDRFIDDLDRAGQAGQMAGVPVPAFRNDLPTGTTFGQLTRADIENLSRFAGSLGRRADIVRTMWADLQRRLKPPSKKRR